MIDRSSSASFLSRDDDVLVDDDNDPVVAVASFILSSSSSMMREAAPSSCSSTVLGIKSATSPCFARLNLFGAVCLSEMAHSIEETIPHIGGGTKALGVEIKRFKRLDIA
jgi:hypothetical protein